MPTTTNESRSQATLARYREELGRGVAMARIVEASRDQDRMNCAPMLAMDEYSRVVRILGTAAEFSRPLWYIIADAVHWVNTYQNRYQVSASLADGFTVAIQEGWFDAARATSPEPGRPSSNRHEVTTETIVQLHHILLACRGAMRVSGGSDVGWCLAAISDEFLTDAQASQLAALKNIR